MFMFESSKQPAGSGPPGAEGEWRATAAKAEGAAPRFAQAAGLDCEGSRQWRWLAVSALIHVSVLGALSWPISLCRAEETVFSNKAIVTLAPPPPHAERESKNTLSDGGELPPPTTLVPPEPDSGAAFGAADLTIAIRRDPTEQLSHALRSWGGHLGFGRPDSAGYFHYLVQASDWRRIDSAQNLFSLAGYFVLRLNRPEQWRFLAPVRSSNSIPDGLNVYALFPLKFFDDLDDAIRAELKAQSQVGQVVATHIEIAFSTETPRKFRVRILSTKPLAPTAPGG